MDKDTKKDELFRRVKMEQKHHKQFDYKEKNKLCLECGETDGRHTYTCVYFDTNK